MSKKPGSVLKDVATALAVLAIHVLTVLTPLHQSAALQRDLAELGFETIAAWSICSAVNEAGDDDTPAALKCPVTGIGKFALTLGNGAPSADEAHFFAIKLDLIAASGALPGIHIVHKARPRAPPVFV